MATPGRHCHFFEEFNLVLRLGSDGEVNRSDRKAVTWGGETPLAR
jgi:hypothetical protein